MLLILTGIVSAQTISVNFAGERNPTGVMGAPGYAASNWLNTANQPSSWGTSYNLQNESGSDTGAVLSVWASQFGAMATFVTDVFSADSQMMECCIGGWETNAASFTVSGVQFNEYAVVVYFASALDFEYVQRINVNNELAVYAKNVRHALVGYVQATATEDMGVSAATGNYAVFTGLTGSTVNVSVDPGWSSSEHTRAYISGFQIVEAVDPCEDGLNKLGDLNGDCLVDLADFTILVNNWLMTGN